MVATKSLALAALFAASIEVAVNAAIPGDTTVSQMLAVCFGSIK
jgi:hypothetical protein